MSEMAARVRALAPWSVKLDPAWAATIVIILALAIVVPDQAQVSVRFTAANLLETAPYLLLSIAIAAYATASGADKLIARAFTGRTTMMIFAAAMFGGLSPFCSCGVIPLIAALLSMGVPLAPVMAFWLASPVIDPSMFVLTSGLLGFDFAVAKTLAAVGLGLFGGFVTMALVGVGQLSHPLRPGVGDGGCGGSAVRSDGAVAWRFWQENGRTARFWRSAGSTTLFLGKWLALAFLLESVMLAYLPAEAVSRAVGGEGVLPLLTATLVGVPAYLNGYAALPLVSGLISQGMAPGAALAFLVAGGVTSIPAAIAVFALVKWRVFVLYVTFALTGSLASGLVYQSVLQAFG